jgi:hypothetical protein
MHAHCPRQHRRELRADAALQCGCQPTTARAPAPSSPSSSPWPLASPTPGGRDANEAARPVGGRLPPRHRPSAAAGAGRGGGRRLGREPGGCQPGLVGGDGRASPGVGRRRPRAASHTGSAACATAAVGATRRRHLGHLGAPPTACRQAPGRGAAATCQERGGGGPTAAAAEGPRPAGGCLWRPCGGPRWPRCRCCTSSTSSARQRPVRARPLHAGGQLPALPCPTQLCPT